jgi:hypothetical protein
LDHLVGLAQAAVNKAEECRVETHGLQRGVQRIGKLGFQFGPFRRSKILARDRAVGELGDERSAGLVAHHGPEAVRSEPIVHKGQLRLVDAEPNRVAHAAGRSITETNGEGRIGPLDVAVGAALQPLLRREIRDLT